jgi:cytochrome P450
MEIRLRGEVACASVVTVAKNTLPPGPMGPALVQSLRYFRDPYGFLQSCRKKYGDWFTVKQIPCGTFVYCADPEAVRIIFADPGTHRLSAINDYMAPVLGYGLLLLDGEAHAERRRWVTPVLTNERVRRFAGDVEALTEAELATWQPGESFALRPRFERLSLRVILRAMFGASAESRIAGLDRMLLQLKNRDIATGVLAALPLGIPKWRLAGDGARNAEAIDRLVFAELAARRAGSVENDGMLGALLADRAAPDDKKVRDELMTLIFSGHETVATTLSWTFERVLRHPAVLAELRTRDDDYCEAVLLETMRQRSALGDVARELGTELRVGSRHLPVGTRVCPAVALLHMREDLFPQPEVFRPERFLDSSKPRPWMYLPFGGGTRRCIGAAFAMLEMQVIVKTVLARVELRAPHPAPERGVGNGVTIGPHKGGLVVMDRRC